MSLIEPVSLGLIGDVGGGELLVILAAILMLFGGKRLPSMARTLGKTAEMLRRTADDFRDQLLNADQDERTRQPPLPGPEPAHGAEPVLTSGAASPAETDANPTRGSAPAAAKPPEAPLP